MTGPHILAADFANPPLDEIPWQRFRWGILESPARTAFETAEQARASLEAAEYPVGRLFGPACELRWRRMRHGPWRFVMIDDEPAGWPADPSPARLIRVRDDRILLWGEIEEDADPPLWSENRIPNSIAYPHTGTDERLCVRTWIYEVVEPGAEPPGESWGAPPRYPETLIERCRELAPAPRGAS